MLGQWLHSTYSLLNGLITDKMKTGIYTVAMAEFVKTEN